VIGLGLLSLRFTSIVPAIRPQAAGSPNYEPAAAEKAKIARRGVVAPLTFDQPGGIRGQFLGCEKDGQKPANALVPLGRSSHAAGQSGDGERQSTTTAPAQARPAYAAPPPDLSANPAFAQSRIKPQTFCRSPVSSKPAPVRPRDNPPYRVNTGRGLGLTVSQISRAIGVRRGTRPEFRLPRRARGKAR